MTRHSNLIVILVLAYCSYATCQSESSCFNEGAPIPLKRANLLSVAKGADRFSTQFFKNLSLQYDTFNVVMSPYSLWGVLRLAYLGSRGTTRKQLKDALGFQSVADGYYNAAALQLTLRNIPGIDFYELNQANFATDINIRPCIFNKVVNLKKTDFQDTTTAAADINADISKVTRGKISKFVSPRDLNGARFILINAVYFKGEWLYPFNEAFTAMKPFYDHTGTKALGKIDMMTASGPNPLMYAKRNGFEVVKLPYDNGQQEASSVSLWVMLPDEGLVVDQILGGLSSEYLEEIDAGMKIKHLEVILPKFSMTLRIAKEVRDGFENLGIIDMFRPGKADFGNFVDTEHIFAQAAMHHATIEINEVGTVAAAASAIIGTRSGGSRVFFNANRPFVYLLRDSDLGLTLFAGVMRDASKLNPKQKQ